MLWSHFKSQQRTGICIAHSPVFRWQKKEKKKKTTLRYTSPLYSHSPSFRLLFCASSAFVSSFILSFIHSGMDLTRDAWLSMWLCTFYTSAVLRVTTTVGSSICEQLQSVGFWIYAQNFVRPKETACCSKGNMQLIGTCDEGTNMNYYYFGDKTFIWRMSDAMCNGAAAFDHSWIRLAGFMESAVSAVIKWHSDVCTIDILFAGFEVVAGCGIAVVLIHQEQSLNLIIDRWAYANWETRHTRPVHLANIMRFHSWILREWLRHFFKVTTRFAPNRRMVAALAFVDKIRYGWYLNSVCECVAWRQIAKFAATHSESIRFIR